VELKMNDVINIKGLPPGARASIIDFYESVKKKYARTAKEEGKSREKLLTLMEKGIYTLPEDFSFDREALYD
jgi:hypothetical protein